MAHFLRGAINEIAFRARELRGRTHTPRELQEPKLDLALLPSFARAMLSSERAAELKERYALESLDGKMLQLGALFLIDLFDRIFSEKPEYFSDLPSTPKILDIGARDFESAPAIYYAFKHKCGAPELTGIELDAFRKIEGGTCADAGAARARMLGRAHRYLAGDVLEHRDRYHAIVWLHPFLDEERVLEWGLPLRFLRPREMMEHVLALLEPHGVLMIVNQDQREDRAQRALFEVLEVSKHARCESFEVELTFRARDEPAYVHLIRT